MAAVSKSFTKAVLAALQHALGRLGFKSRRGGLLVLQVDADAFGTVGLNVSTRRDPGVLEVNPVVGVRHQMLEKLVAELIGIPFNESIPPTLSANIGYVSPLDRYRPFLFEENTDITGGVAELVRELEVHGLPFIRRMRDLRTLVDAMQTVRFGVRHQSDYRIPVGLLLLGDHSQARAALNIRLAERETHSDPEALQFKKFAGKLLERIDASVP